jgi:hypothetical protein
MSAVHKCLLSSQAAETQTRERRITLAQKEIMDGQDFAKGENKSNGGRMHKLHVDSRLRQRDSRTRTLANQGSTVLSSWRTRLPNLTCILGNLVLFQIYFANRHHFAPPKNVAAMQ